MKTPRTMNDFKAYAFGLALMTAAGLAPFAICAIIKSLLQ